MLRVDGFSRRKDAQPVVPNKIFFGGEAQADLNADLGTKGKLHAFLELNENEILQGAGKVSKQLADELALREYDKFQEQRRLAGDVDASLDDALGTAEKEVKMIAKSSDGTEKRGGGKSRSSNG